MASKLGIIRAKTNCGFNCMLENALYSRVATNNLLSLERMRLEGVTTTFDKEGIIVSKDGKPIMIADSINHSIFVSLEIDKTKTAYACSKLGLNNNYDLWHQRLGHISKDKF